MYLFLLTCPTAQTDEIDSILVVAYDEEHARKIAQQAGDSYYVLKRSIWLEPSYTTCELINPSDPGPLFVSTV